MVKRAPAMASAFAFVAPAFVFGAFAFALVASACAFGAFACAFVAPAFCVRDIRLCVRVELAFRPAFKPFHWLSGAGFSRRDLEAQQNCVDKC